MNQILKKPIITEKSLDLASRGWYTFAVSHDSHKRAIAQSIEAYFKVHVTKIKTLNVARKKIRTGKKRLLKLTSPWKKAIVRLREKEKIDLFTVETQPVPKP